MTPWNAWVVALAATAAVASAPFVASADPGDLSTAQAYRMVDSGTPTSVVVQPDGRTILASTYDGIVVHRLLPSGLPDVSFATNGTVEIPFQRDRAHVIDVALSGSDIVVLLTDEARGFDSRIELVRLDSTGELVPTFGTDGRQILSVIGWAPVPTDLAIDPDGRILVAVNDAGGSVSPRLWALTPLGGWVDTFGDVGEAVVPGGDAGSWVWSVDTNDTGGILTVSTDATSFGNVSIASRVDRAGQPVRRFGGDGSVRLRIGRQARTSFVDAAFGPDRTIVLGGGSARRLASPTRFLTARLRAGDGRMDTSFGGDGWSTARLDALADVSSMSVQDNGAVVLLASTTPDGEYAVARFRSTGQLDTRFGADGIVSWGLGGVGDSIKPSDLTIAPSGRRAYASGYMNNDDDTWSILTAFDLR